MPYIQFKDRQFPLGPADLTVGAYDGATVRLPGDDPAARAVLTVGPDGTGIIRRGGPAAVVLINGVNLGAEPSPLIHGDKIELGGQALAYGDDKKGGSTQFISASDIPEAIRAKIGAPRKPTAATGGRLVSLVDGREYAVPDTGASFGREIGNEIVISSTDVSRRHAEVVPGADGYVLNDLSTNGVYVNGVRVEKSQVLGRGDVIKIGPEEYRFYADVPKVPTPPAATPIVPPAALPNVPSLAATLSFPARKPTPPAVPAVPVASSIESIELLDVIQGLPSAPAPKAPVPTPAAPKSPAPPSVAPRSPAPVPPVPKAPATAPPAARAPLAVLEVINEGPIKGTRFEIFTPLTNVGRGAHNDLALNDESVSDSHAKILKREGAWWLVDQGSTNGTYIGGRRVEGEKEIVGSPDVRFGSVKMRFTAIAQSGDDEGKGTRAIAAFNVTAARKQQAPASRGAAATSKVEPAAPPAEAKKKGCAAMIAFLFAAAAIGASTLAVLLSTRG
jgi:pSer/pThr/pTyr-binding forkhead associated (FHA) protein